MGVARRNPAVYAGVAAAVAAMLPNGAYALSVEQLTTGEMAPYVHYGLGCITGAALTTAAFTVALSLRSVRKAKAHGGKAEQGAVDEAPVAQADPTPSSSQVRRRARHMGVREWEASGIIRVQAPEAEPAEPAPSGASEPKAAQDDSRQDYGDVAEEYVRRKSLREQVTSRASGVASVLASRLGTSNMFDDMPIIERADGTVGDVGTSWWNAALGSSIRGVEDLTLETAEDVNSVASSYDLMASRPAQPVEPRRPSAGETRSAYISKNVAEVDVGIYPEHRSAAELDGEDIWDMALKAMDEQLTQQAPAVFHDVIGGLDTIDEPGDLEAPTGFIPFRTPAGHPEVVDTNTYVDYLIDDEFSRNPSPVARRSSHQFLTVIQGGSQKMPAVQEDEHVPRHMARREAAAKEA